MKKSLLTLSILAAFGTTTLAQTSSVELKDAGNALIGSYNSITAAYAAIPSTITQPYVIELTSAYTGVSETFPINFSVRSGSSSTNTITLRPAAGVTSVTISSAGSGTNILQLNDADYMVIDGRPGGTGTTNALTIANTATASNSNTVVLINGATYNVIRNCNINNASTTNAGRGLLFSTSASNPGGNSNNLVTDCLFTGGRYVINSNGTAASFNTKNTISNCDIVNIPFAGIWYQAGTGSMAIEGNRFYCTTSTGDGPFAILFDAQTDTVVVGRNHIYEINNGTKTSLVKGIAFRSVTGTSYSVVHNNMVAMSSTNSGSTSVVGIEYAIGSGVTNASIYFNTVRIQGTLNSGGSSGAVVSAAFQKTGSAAGSVYNIYNNLFVNERAGGAANTQHVAYAITNTAGTINSDYNHYFASSGNHARYGTTLYSTLSGFQSAVSTPNEGSSQFATAQFVSATDLHLSGTSIGDPALAGIPVSLQPPLPDINFDFDNQSRGTLPYRGADEGAVPLPLELLSFSAQWRGANALLTWETADEKPGTIFGVQRSFDGQSFRDMGVLAAKASEHEPHVYNFTDDQTGTSDNLYYRLRISGAGGAVNFSPTVRLQRRTMNEGDVDIYPVPFRNSISVRSGALVGKIVQASLTDALGKTVLQRLLTVNDLLQLDGLQSLPSGVYLLSIDAEGLHFQRRVTK